MKYDSKYSVQPFRLDDEPEEKEDKPTNGSWHVDEKTGKVFF